MYLKRNKVPRKWAIPRKGTKYLVVPLHSLNQGIPLLIVLREMLKVIRIRKEAKKILNLGKIKINNKIIREEKFPLTLFDILDLDGKTFKIIIKNKKFNLIEVKGREAEEKIVKVKDKKIVKGNKVQINLSDGRNYLFKEKINTGDSVVIDLKENKIKDILPFKQNSKVLFIKGKHIGEEGLIEEIDKERKFISVKKEKEKINSRKGNLMVIK